MAESTSVPSSSGSPLLDIASKFLPGMDKRSQPSVVSADGSVQPHQPVPSNLVFEKAPESYELNRQYRQYAEKLRESNSATAQAAVESSPLMEQAKKDFLVPLKHILEADIAVAERLMGDFASMFGKNTDKVIDVAGKPLNLGPESLTAGQFLQRMAPGLIESTTQSLLDKGWKADKIATLLALPAFAVGMIFDPVNLVAPPVSGPAARVAQKATKKIVEPTRPDKALELFKATPGIKHAGREPVKTKDLIPEHELDEKGQESAKRYAEKYRTGEPVEDLVVRKAKDGKTFIMSGHARTAGAKEAGKDTVHADVFVDNDVPLPVDTAEEVLASFKADGNGATYSLTRGDLGKVGSDEWAVSIFPERHVAFAEREPNADDIRTFIQQNQDVLSNPRVSVGLWKDDAGVIHLEPSYVTASRPQAEALGRQFDQDSIFHIGTKDLVKTGGSGKPDLSKLPPFETRLGTDQVPGLVDEFPAATPLSHQFEMMAAPAVDALRLNKQGAALTPHRIAAHLKVAGAAAIYRGANTLVGFKRALMPDLPQRVLQEMTEKKWESLFSQSQTRVASLIEQFGKNEVPTIAKVQEMYRKGEYNRAWYNEFRPVVESMFGTESRTLPSGVVTNDSEMFARFFAATSPQTAVEGAEQNNVNLAVRAFIEWKTGKPFSNTFEGHRKNLERVAQGLPFDVTSPKVSSFFLNLWGDPNAVTVDGHMARAFGFSPDNMKQAKYQFIQEVIRQEARRAGVPPRDYQAAVWAAHSTLTGMLKEGEFRDVVTVLRSELQKMVDKSPEELAELHNWQQILDAANIRKPGFLDGQAFHLPLQNAAKFSTLNAEMKQLAKVYNDAPVFDPQAVPLWEKLAEEVDQHYAEISQKVKMVPVADDAPYKTAAEMFADIERGQLKISTLHNEHPVFTPEQNLRFRFVHDYLGHYKGQADFSLAGEQRTYSTQMWAHSKEAQEALRVEVLGQASAAIEKGGFQKQKVFRLNEQPMILEEAGRASLGATLLLARMFAGAVTGTMVGDEENTLRNALVGAGLGALATPSFLTAVAKKLQAQKAQPSNSFFATPQGQQVTRVARQEAAMTPHQMALDYQQALKETTDIHTWREAREEAELLVNYGVLDETYLRNMLPGKTLNDAEVVAASKVMVNSYQHLRTLASQYKANPTMTNAHELVKQLVAHGRADIGRQIGTAEAARALNIHKEVMKETEYLNAAGDLLSRLKAGQNIDRIADLILYLPDPMAAATAARVTSKPGFADMAMEAWVLGLVSGVKTLTTNLIGNSVMMGMTVASRGLARGFGHAVAPGEMKAMLQGMMQSFNDSLAASWKLMKDFESIHATNPELLAKYDLKERAITAENVQDLYAMRKLGIHLFDTTTGEPNVLGQAVNWIGSALRFPARALVGPDVFFRGITLKAELNARALREARDEALASGLEGSALKQAVEQNYAKLLANPPDDILRAAKEFAAYSVFQKELGELGKAVQEFSVAHPLSKLILPFVKTPSNLLKVGVEHSPFAFLTRDFYAALKRGGADAQLAVTKMSMGSMTMAFFAMLASQGIITGSAPSNPAARKIDQDNGVLPGALNLSKALRLAAGTDDGSPLPQKGDTFIELDRFDPLGMQLIMAADFVRMAPELSEQDLADAALGLGALAMKTAASRSWIRGVAELSQGIADPDRYGQRVLQRLGGTFVPFSGFASNVTQFVDPTVREAHSVWEEMKKRTWPFSTSVIPQRDLFGKPMLYPQALGPDGFSPLPLRTYRDHPVLSALKNDDVVLSVPRQSFPLGGGQSIQLEPKELDRLRVLAGQEVTNALGQNFEQAMLDVITQAQEFGRTTGPNSWRAAKFQEVAEEFKARARAQLLQEFPDLAEAAKQADIDDRTAKGKPIFNF